jgi:hypothetical protein
MTVTTRILLLMSLIPAAPALAQRPAAPPSGFSGLFTPWSGVNRDSLQAEVEQRRRAAAASIVAAPDQQRRYTAAAALGERVGEIVRQGDCEQGERLAREAGDLALVRAVRGHCGLGAAPVR